jgi:hypothetical protein
MRRNSSWDFLLIALCGLSAMAQHSATTAPAQAPQVTLQGPQRPQPPGHQQPTSGPSSRTAQAPLTSIQAPYPGTLEGYVYWDTNTVKHNPPLSCSGLTVTISVGTPPSGSTPAFEQFKPLGTYNTFTYLNNGSTLGVCAYGVHQVPVGQDLQVQVGVTAAVFTAPVAPGMPPKANNPNSPIKITSGVCNNLQPAVPSPSVLNSKWWTCGNSAYNVNFVLQASGSMALMSATGGQGLLSGSSTGQAGPGPKNAPARGMLAGGASATQPQAASGAIPGNRSEPLAAQPGRKALTNADVVKMVNAGVPESAIITSIQSSPTKFDLSLDGLRSLHRAGVGQAILETMKAGGGVASDSGVSSNGPAKEGVSATRGPTADPSLQVKLGPPKIGPQVKNSRASQISAATIGVLQKQKSAADIEVSQMKLAIRPQVQAGTLGGQSQTMSAGTSSAISNSSPAALLQAQAVSSVGSSGGSGGHIATGGIPSSIAHLQYVNTTALTCTNDPSFRILNVSGSFSPATFTPIDQYDLYTINGCSFGNPGSSDKVYIYGAGSFQGNFAIKFWSDNSIAVSLDESITGYPDLSNIALVVQRNDGQQAQKQGFKFYAARQTVPLTTVPSSWVTLATLTTGFGNTLAAQYSSPPSSFQGPGPAAGTAYVSRFSNGTKFNPTGQNDYYDFSQLSPGWTTDSLQLTTYDQSCPFVITYKKSFGTWYAIWDKKDPNNIQVWLSDTICSGFLPPAPWVNYRNLTGSYYALKVWVSGPRGIDPLTGHPGP